MKTVHGVNSRQACDTRWDCVPMAKEDCEAEFNGQWGSPLDQSGVVVPLVVSCVKERDGSNVRTS